MRISRALAIALWALASEHALAQGLSAKPGPRPAIDRPLEVNPQQYALNKDPDVLFLRKTFDRYLRGETRDIHSIALTGIQKQKTDGLRNYDKSYFKSKLLVVQIAPFVGGGNVVTVIFVGRPDRLFDCWVYTRPDGGRELRAFTQDPSFSAEELQLVYRNYLRDSRAHL